MHQIEGQSERVLEGEGREYMDIRQLKELCRERRKSCVDFVKGFVFITNGD